MKHSIYISILFAIIIMLIVQLADAQNVCIELARQQSSLSCEKEVSPVCGCNGVTYPNSCVAQKNGLTSYKAGKCLKSDSVKQGSIIDKQSDCFSKQEDSLFLQFIADSLYVSGIVNVAQCSDIRWQYSISGGEIIIYQDTIGLSCKSSCFKSINFSVPISVQPSYHILIAGHLDTVFYLKPPVVLQDTLDFAIGKCLGSQFKSKISATYSNESLLLQGVAQLNCCAFSKVHYTVSRSIIRLMPVEEGTICNCQCSYQFECKLPNIEPGMYRIICNDLDTLISVSPSVVSENTLFSLSSDSVVIQVAQTGLVSIECDDISGFQLRNDNSKALDAKIFGKDLSIRGIESGICILRITNKQGLERICKVFVEEAPQNINIRDSVQRLAFSTNKSYLMQYATEPAKTPVLWRSTNENVASVDAMGLLTIRSIGTTKIIANILNTNKSDTCVLVVFDNSKSSIFDILSVSNSIIRDLDSILTLGQTRQLTISWNTAQQSQEIQWFSLNPSVISIANDGRLVANAEGRATVIARVNGLQFIDSLTFIVRSATEIEYNNYNPFLGRVTMQFSKDINVFFDNTTNWSLVDNEHSWDVQPSRIYKLSAQQMSLQFDSIPQTESPVFVNVKKDGALIFADNSVLLRGTYRCKSEVFATNTTRKKIEEEIYYSNKTLFFQSVRDYMTVDIYNINGELVLKTQIVQSNKLDLQPLSAGFYFAHLQHVDEFKVFPFVVTH